VPDPEKLDSLIENYLEETLGQNGFCEDCGLPVYGPRQLCTRCAWMEGRSGRYAIRIDSAGPPFLRSDVSGTQAVRILRDLKPGHQLSIWRLEGNDAEEV
jgi:hypothetical protein